MESYPRRSSGGVNLLLAFVCGALTGAIAALLFAPESARRAVEEARHRGEDALDQIRTTASGVVTEARAAFESARAEAAKGEKS